MTLQTRHAQRLWEGRTRSADRPAICGLVGFADRMRVLWNAAQADDPYADWYLVQVEERLQRSTDTLRNLKVQSNGLEASSDLEWSAAQSQTPLRIQLRFATPYAYRGAHLLAHFDRLARRLLSARFLGILEPDRADLLLRTGGRSIRSAFDSPSGYRSFQIDRDGVLTGTPAAQLALAAMGELPADILAEERLAALRPRRRQTFAVEDDIAVLENGDEATLNESSDAAMALDEDATS